MTDSMNFGPDWIRNLSSEGTIGGGTGGGTRYQLADHRYGREEMLALFDKSVKPPSSLLSFKSLYSEHTLVPLALLPTNEDERGWQSRPNVLSGPPRGRGGSMERGGRVGRGRGGSYPSYGRPSSYDSGWGNGEQPEWSPRKEYNSSRPSSMENWRRGRVNLDEEDGWRSVNSRSVNEKWSRTPSWRFEGGDGADERGGGAPERGSRATWHERGGTARRSWENDEHLPEWATENPTDGGGTFDERGAFHGSDDEDDRKSGGKRELLKSTSQQHISNKNIPPLTSSKSALSLNKTDIVKSDVFKKKEIPPEQFNNENVNEKQEQLENVSEKMDNLKSSEDENKTHSNNKLISEKTSDGSISETNSNTKHMVEEDFERLQEDFVLKLVENEDGPKVPPVSTAPTFDVGGNIQPPPNLVPPPSQDKWYYQDPQGTRQGPFLNVEMAEWYKAGYFSNQLNIMRECDDRYFMLGELITICGGENPFLSGIRFPILKNENKLPPPPPTATADDILTYQYLTQLAFKPPLRTLEPWTDLTTLQQQELAAQRLLLQQQQQQPQQQPQIPHDLSYIQQPQNSLMFMINQMQQQQQQQQQNTAKIPVVDKPTNNPVMDSLLQIQMGTNMQTPNLHNHLPVQATLPPPSSLSTSLPNADSLANFQNSGITIPGIHSGLPTSSTLQLNRPNAVSLEQLPQNPTDPLTCFLKQCQQMKQRPLQMDALWSKSTTNQFGTQPTQQWTPQPTPDVPLGMWDMQPPQHQPQPPSQQQQQQQQQSSNSNTPTIQQSTTPINQQQSIIQMDSTQLLLDKSTLQLDSKEKEINKKDDISLKELRRKKEAEEKQNKKEAEEKRKQEQRKQEAEKKALEEKKKKEEERVKRELEKAKKEAEEKRLRELEEKRKLKEQRKAEEEARKKADELKKLEEEKLKREREEKKLNELRLNQQQQTQQSQQQQQQQQQQTTKSTKTAPWSQSNSNHGISLTDIQRAEKEKRAQEALIQLQKQQQLELQIQQQHQQNEKSSSGLQLNWAKKPIDLRKVKTVAEIQAEEQEHLAKLANEARLAAQEKEKNQPQICNTGSIWNGQSLSWATTANAVVSTSSLSTNSQWLTSSTTNIGFWDDTSSKTIINKPSIVTKSSSTSAMTNVNKQQLSQQQQIQKQSKNKSKKDEAKTNINNNNSNNDEFINWCHKSLANMSSNVDVPTFVTFLRDIESAFDVREYCKEYLGDTPATQQFAANFLEKRRSFKPKTNAHKDDMCSPAPAITPSTQHNNAEFQEVKGKNKKNKKSKMLKVDSRILGFNVTSAPDRINVGDRDYGDNS